MENKGYADFGGQTRCIMGNVEMVNSKSHHQILINGTPLEDVDKFVYLGSEMKGSWREEIAISRRQEIIKVREWIPHIGPLTKVILLKLFLDIVPSSSEEATRAMRGQQVEARRNGGNVILYVSI